MTSNLNRFSTAAVLIFLISLWACSPDRPSDSKAPDMPEIVLPDLEGNTIKLSDFKGQVIMLNFWATWCPPCQAEIPDFIDLQAELGEEGLAIVGVSLDHDRVNVVRDYSLKKKINYTVLYAGEKSEEVSELVGGIRGIPTTFLIDREGRVVSKVVGAAEKKAWKNAIKPLL